MDQPINLREKLTRVAEYWAPRIVGTLNDLDLMVVRVKDEFVWHSHPDTDDFFLVIDGRLDIELRDRTVTLKAGELFVVPRGVEHKPVARHGEALLLIIEPSGTPNTGDPTTAVVKTTI
jgi:mannose-6-phosphate isomerase-like protein (cupin superfamily)